MIPIGDTQKSSNFPVVTVTILTLNIFIFIIQLFTEDIVAFYRDWAFTPAFFSFINPETWYTLITAAFLHGGITHIAFNMLFLWVFGDNVEEHMGSIKYTLFYLVAAIGATLLQYAIDPSSTIPTLGASGAIAGILGYYLMVFPTHSIKTLMLFGGGIFQQNIPAQVFLGYWAITQFFNGFGSLATANSGGVAWFAHIGGLLIGVLFGYLAKKSRPTGYYIYE